MDFGLKTYLALADGTTYESPLFFKRNARSVDFPMCISRFVAYFENGDNQNQLRR